MPQTPGTTLEPPAVPVAAPPPRAPAPPPAATPPPEPRPATPPSRSPLRPHRSAALVAIVLLVATAVSTVIGIRTVSEQEQRQLDVRAAEAAAVISSSLGSLDATLTALVAAADLAPAHHTVFDSIAQPMVTPHGNLPAAYRQVVAARRSASGMVVSAATDPRLVGTTPPAGEVSTTLSAAFAAKGVLQSTPVFVAGGGRSIGFAKALAGVTAVFVEMPVASYTAPSSQGAFSDLSGALYTTSTQQPDQAVLASTRELPVSPPVGTSTISVGASHWLLVARARTPLVSSLALALPWLLLGAGLVTTVLATLVVEGLARRRDYALGLVTVRTAELRRRAAELERSNAALQRFAYVASHDLSEPLRTVSGFATLLSRRYGGRLDADADEFLGYITGGVSHMQALIEALLGYSRLDTRAQPFVPLHTADVVAEVLAELDRRIDETGAVVQVGALPDVVADRTQLVQVFQNLLRNALIFVAPGVVPRVEISGSTDVADGAWSFAVADNGIGIEPPYRERVFEMFHRLHPRDVYPGTGMGLATCKRVVDRHGGRIWVEDNPGGGCIFRFTIPFPAPAQDAGGEEG